MRSISISQAQTFDKFAQEKLGIPSIILMENAGRSAAEEALKMIKRIKKGKGVGIGIVCGVGNNGGDGLVAARHLINAGIKVKVYLLDKVSKLKTDPRTNYNIFKKMKQKIEVIGKPETKRLGFQGARLIIDAIFGIGLTSEVREPYSSIINYLNQTGIPILSVDVPSGLHADTGKVLGSAIRAKRTVTFVAPKKGFSKASGPKCCGKIIVSDIGIDPKTC